jgi:hypothetical protein
MDPSEEKNRYVRIIERIFLDRYQDGSEKVPFEREDIERAAGQLGIRLPKNIGDLIYSFRFRTQFPESITSKAPRGKSWIIRLVGRSRYAFVACRLTVIAPRPDMAVTKVPDATPGIIDKYALGDEQALLAKLRYNRLVDVFTGVTCYSLQSHLRTSVPQIGQVETDEVYIGLDRRGVHYVFPVQAKGGKDKQNVVQVEQDIGVCAAKFPLLICRPLAAQFMSDGTIAMFELECQGDDVAILSEKHYRLVPQESLTPADLKAYANRPGQ